MATVDSEFSQPVRAPDGWQDRVFERLGCNPDRTARDYLDELEQSTDDAAEVLEYWHWTEGHDRRDVGGEG